WRPSDPTTLFSEACSLFAALGALLPGSSLCFQSFTASFCKTPRGGGGMPANSPFEINKMQTLFSALLRIPLARCAKFQPLLFGGRLAMKHLALILLLFAAPVASAQDWATAKLAKSPR